MIKNKIVQDLVVGLIIAVITVALGYWLNTRYSLPLIEVDAEGGFYGRIHDIPVGSIFIGNSGYKTDKNISIKIDDDISEKDVNIPGLITDYTVKNAPDGTVITIKELRPSENFQIFFSPKDKSVKYFNILSVVSESNNIYDLYYVDWWDISFELKILFSFLILLALFLGWYIPRRILFYRKSGI